MHNLPGLVIESRFAFDPGQDLSLHINFFKSTHYKISSTVKRLQASCHRGTCLYAPQDRHFFQRIMEKLRGASPEVPICRCPEIVQKGFEGTKFIAVDNYGLRYNMRSRVAN